jgi:hypothetical protein
MSEEGGSMRRRDADTAQQAVTGPLPRMMIGFIVRRCTIDLGHAPTAAEFAAWANAHGDAPHPVCLFGRAITEDEAGLILKHQSRLVSAKSAQPDEQFASPEDLPLAAKAATVIPITKGRRGPRVKVRSR